MLPTCNKVPWIHDSESRIKDPGCHILHLLKNTLLLKLIFTNKIYLISIYFFYFFINWDHIKMFQYRNFSKLWSHYKTSTNIVWNTSRVMLLIYARDMLGIIQITGMQGNNMEVKNIFIPVIHLGQNNKSCDVSLY